MPPAFQDISYYEALGIERERAIELRKSLVLRVIKAAREIKTEGASLGRIASFSHISSSDEQILRLSDIRRQYSLNEMEKMMHIVSVSMGIFESGGLYPEISRAYLDEDNSLSRTSSSDLSFRVNVLGDNLVFHRRHEMVHQRDNKYQRFKEKHISVDFYLTKN